MVTTASYEARRFGIFSATPAERARRLCPQAVFIAPDFEAYRARSREVMDVLRAQVERVEVVGLDEAYLDLSGFERPRAAARRVKAAVTAHTGLGCSIGIGPEQAGGQGGLRRREARRLRGARRTRRRASASPAPPPGLVPGIGPKTAARLEREGIVTLGQLAALPDERLAGWFGSRLGPYLGRLARFEDDRLIETEHGAKSESRETTFDRDLRGVAELAPQLRQLTEQLCATLAKHDRRGRTIGIKVRYDDFSIVTRARSLPAAVNELESVWEVAHELLRRLDPPRPVRLIGVRVAGLDEVPAAPVSRDQLSLSL